MMETAFATPDDVVARWRPLSEAEMSVVDTLLDDASNMIRDRWPDVDERIAAETLREASVTRAVSGMVKRALLNSGAEGVASQAQGAGPFSVNTTYSNPNGNLFFSAEDVRLFDGRAVRRAFGVDLSANVPPCEYDGGFWR